MYPTSAGPRRAPPGYYSQTELRKQFRLKPAQLQQLQPALVWRTRYGVDCLLYKAADLQLPEAA